MTAEETTPNMQTDASDPEAEGVQCKAIIHAQTRAYSYVEGPPLTHEA